jgi:DMSO reductase anchor subunit
MIADRYAYMASIGIFFLLAYFADKAMDIIKYRNLTMMLACIYTFSIGVYAHQRTRVWHNSDTLKKELNELLDKKENYSNNPTR